MLNIFIKVSDLKHYKRTTPPLIEGKNLISKEAIDKFCSVILQADKNDIVINLTARPLLFGSNFLRKILYSLYTSLNKHKVNFRIRVFSTPKDILLDEEVISLCKEYLSNTLNLVSYSKLFKTENKTIEVIKFLKSNSIKMNVYFPTFEIVSPEKVIKSIEEYRKMGITTFILTSNCVLYEKKITGFKITSRDQSQTDTEFDFFKFNHKISTYYIEKIKEGEVFELYPFCKNLLVNNHKIDELYTSIEEKKFILLSANGDFIIHDNINEEKIGNILKTPISIIVNNINRSLRSFL